MCVGGGGRGGYSDIFYIYVSWDHFWGFKILNFNIFFFFLGGRGFRNIILLGVWRFCGYYHYKTGLVLGVISIHFRFFFLRSMCRMGILFGVAQNYKYILGSGWYSLYILGVDSRCWVQAYVWRKTREYIIMSKFKTPKYIIKCAQNIGCICLTWEQP